MLRLFVLLTLSANVLLVEERLYNIRDLGVLERRKVTATAVLFVRLRGMGPACASTLPCESIGGGADFLSPTDRVDYS